MEQEPQEREVPRVTEEAILDSLFYACDDKGSGFVAVSKLIDYLRSAIASDTDNNNIEFVDNLDDISLILDPEGQDVHIDISTYQAGINVWIDDIRKRSIASVDDDLLSSVSINCGVHSPFQSFQSDRHDHHVTSTPNLSSNSVEGIGGESPQKNDSDRAAEMISIIETLQLNNKRLTEQHALIQAQMEQTEETNTQLHAENKSLKKQLQSLQSLSSKLKEMEFENLELRQSVGDSKEISTDLQNQNALMIKDKKNLETCIEQLQSKLISTQVHLDALQDERRALSESLSIQKQVNIRLEELQNDKEDLVQESSSKSDYLSSVIHELSLANEDLRTEKKKLTEALSDLNGELSRLKKHNSPNTPSHMEGPHQTSTPCRKHFSLKQELEEQLYTDTKDLPSPLIGTSLPSDSLNQSDTSNQSCLDQSWVSFLSCDSANNSFESYSIIASQVANEFRDKKERALQQIEELDKLEKTPEVKEKQQQLKIQFDKDVEQFAEKVNLLSIKKKNAEKRSAKLLVAMRKLKEESKQMQDERDKAYQKLGNMSLNTDHLDTRVSDLQSQLANEKTKSREMEDKLMSLQHQLSAVNSELSRIRDDKDSMEQSLMTHRESKQSLEKLLDDINRSHSQLDVQQAHQILRIKELENELARASSNMTIEKQRVTALEESLQLSVNTNSTELQEIIEMIPSTDNEITIKNKSSPRASSPRITGHAVRTRLHEFLNKVDDLSTGQDSVRAPPDGKPITETRANTLEGRSTPRLPSPPFSSLSSQSPDRSLQSPIGRERLHAEVNTDLILGSSWNKDVKSTESQTDLTLDSLGSMIDEMNNEKKVSSSDEPKLLSLWRRKLSPTLSGPDDDLVDGEVSGIDASFNSSHFVDGVGLHVRPPPNEREIEKQFRTLVLAFQTDQQTLNKRLEVQARSRDIAERSINRELQNLSSQMKNLEDKYMRTKELQQAASALKAQVEVVRRSAQRLGIVAQQHGSVQQESRMWSGIEVMICHSENLNRHLEKVKHDLSDFRKKEHLSPDDSDFGEPSPPQGVNGPKRLEGCGEEHKAEKQPDASADNTNSLANFVMAIHNTSQRAKQVLRNFRRRTIDASSFHSSREEHSGSSNQSRQESIDEGTEEETGERDSEASGASGNISDEDGSIDFVSDGQESPGIQKPGIGRRICVSFCRFIFSVILIMVLFVVTIVFLNHNTSYRLQREQIPKAILDVLDPIATLVHLRRPTV